MTAAKRAEFPSGRLAQFVVRLPDGMREWIKKEAARNRRSMNSEIVTQLERAYGLLEAAGDRIAPLNPAASANTAARQGGEVVNHG